MGLAISYDEDSHLKDAASTRFRYKETGWRNFKVPGSKNARFKKELGSSRQWGETTETKVWRHPERKDAE